MRNDQYYAKLMARRDALSPVMRDHFDGQFLSRHKSQIGALIRSFFGGLIAIDRFYLGQPVSALFKIIRPGLGYIADLFLIASATRDKNIETADNILKSIDMDVAMNFMGNIDREYYKDGFEPKIEYLQDMHLPPAEQYIFPADIPTNLTQTEYWQQLFSIRNNLNEEDWGLFDQLFMDQFISPTNVTGLGLFLGAFGLDRFKLGDTKGGLIKIGIFASLFGAIAAGVAISQLYPILSLLLVVYAFFVPLVLSLDVFKTRGMAYQYNMRKALNISYLIKKRFATIDDTEIQAFQSQLT